MVKETASLEAEDQGEVDSGAPLETAPPELQSGDVLAGRYEIGGVLGRGATATVYRAYDRVTEQTVALKALHPGSSASASSVQRLARELRHGRLIQHPNVCRVFDLFESDGHTYLTMEHAPLGTLRSTLAHPPAD